MKSGSIYEALLEQDDIHLPHRGKTPVDALEQIRVREAMRTNVVTLAANLTVAPDFSETGNTLS